MPEIAALFAAGYLRLALGAATDAATPPHDATCAARKSTSGRDNPLDAFGDKSVHVSLGGESPDLGSGEPVGQRRGSAMIPRAKI